MIELRDYQIAARDSVLDFWRGGGGCPLVEVPTGGGKSLIMASLIQECHATYGARILLLSHVQELVEQDAIALQRLWPEAPLGIYSAGLGRKDKSAPVVFGSVQSLYKSPDVVGERDLVIIDEAHLLSRKADSQYHRVLKTLKERSPHLRVAGFTATPWRTDSGLLTDGWRDTPPLFDEIVYKIGVLELIERGLLSRLVPYAPATRLDVTGVKKTAGEYNQKQLQAAVDIEDINARAVQEIVRAGEDRAGWLVFSSGVDHAQHLRDLVRSHGISTEMILGDTAKAERRDIIQRFKNRELRCLVGANVLTTGFDAPHVDLLAVLRPTASKGLHTQILGRGLRISPLKENCVVLDFAGNVMRHGPLDMIDGKKEYGGPRPAPIKECPECHLLVHAPVEWCPQCNYHFPIDTEPKFSSTPNSAAIFSTQEEPVWHDLESVIFRRHQKEGKPDSLRIDYTTKFMTIPHWLALDSEQGRAMAKGWWSKHSHSGSPPDSVTEALNRTDDIRVPGRIQVIKDGKFRRIVSWDYTIPPGRIVPTMRQLSHGKFFRPKLRTPA